METFISNYLYNTRKQFIVIHVYLIDVLISFTFSLLFPKTSSLGYVFQNFYEEFILVVIIAPIIETYLFQHLLIKIIELKLNKRNLILPICSIVFGLLHLYNLVYFFKACISGFLYSFLYLSIREKKSNPIYYVFLCHSVYNLTGFLANHLF